MDRLTRKGQDFENDFCLGCDCGYYGEPYGCNSPDGECESYRYFTQLADRLAEYEDTGLSPAEVAELVQAKKEGRLAVWPRGEIGDYVEWDNGIETQLFEIHGILIRRGEIRYDLGDICPLVDSPRIKKIVPREEAEATLKESENNA